MANGMREAGENAVLNKQLPEAVDRLIEIRIKCGSLPIPDEEGMAKLREELKNEICRETEQYKISGLESIARTPIMRLAEILEQTDSGLLNDGETLKATDQAAAEGVRISNRAVMKIRTRWLHKGRRHKVRGVKPEVPELRSQLGEVRSEPECEVIKLPPSIKEIRLRIAPDGGVEISLKF